MNRDSEVRPKISSNSGSQSRLGCYHQHRGRTRRRQCSQSTRLCCGFVMLFSSTSGTFLPSTQSLAFPAASIQHLSSRLFQPKILILPNQRHRVKGTARFMVLTTPESIIEQASTQKLLDDLIDESVRTSARRPIMLQFDPSSGWVRP